MPAGLTAIVVQTQALFTVLFAALIAGDRPTTQQMSGMLFAFVGLAMIGLTLDTAIPLAAFVLTLGSAISWAIGNVVVKRLPKTDMLRLMVWASLVPPILALVISAAMDPPGSLITALSEASWPGLVAPIYLGLVASALAYAIWGNLLQRYPAGAVAPFALLAPAVGAIASSIVYSENFGPVRLVGMAFMLAGLAIVVLPRQSIGIVFRYLGSRA